MLGGAASGTGARPAAETVPACANGSDAVPRVERTPLDRLRRNGHSKLRDLIEVKARLCLAVLYAFDCALAAPVEGQGGIDGDTLCAVPITRPSASGRARWCSAAK